MSKITVETRTATFHEIFAKAACSAWVRLLWEDQGRVVILSDYGNWAYYWGDIGGQTVAEFLSHIDIAYMGGKMLGSKIRHHSDGNTVKAIKEEIIRLRRDNRLTKEQARDEWDWMSDYSSGDIDFRGWVETSKHLLDEPWELSRTEMCSEWFHFWQRLWVPLVQPALIEFAAQEKNAVPV